MLVSLPPVGNPWVTVSPIIPSNGLLINIAEICAIVFGVLGALLNAFLFWVISNNISIDKKCKIIYKNLTIIDFFNCLVIPICYFSLEGHGYDIELNLRNGIVYLLFGGTINLPYMLLILLSIVRILVFRHRIFYSQRLHYRTVYAICVLIWCCGIIAPVVVWVIDLLFHHHGNKTQTHLLYHLLRYNSWLSLVLIITTLLIMTFTCFRISTLNLSTNDTTQLLRMSLLQTELRSVVVTFFYFIISVTVWSFYPFLFSLTFSLCGPDFQVRSSYCNKFGNAFFADPKLSYALMSLSLCFLSISNCFVLLSQRSFTATIDQGWSRWSCITTSEEGEEGEEYRGAAPSYRPPTGTVQHCGTIPEMSSESE